MRDPHFDEGPSHVLRVAGRHEYEVGPPALASFCVCACMCARGGGGGLGKKKKKQRKLMDEGNEGKKAEGSINYNSSCVCQLHAKAPRLVYG